MIGYCLKISLLILILLFGFVQIESKKKVSNVKNDFVNASPNDVWVQVSSASRFSEVWTYQFIFQEDIRLYIVFTVANFGRLKSPVSGVRVSVHGFGDQVYQIEREYPLEDLLQDRDNYLFSLNPRQDNIWFKGKLPEKHQIYINTAKDGIRFDIQLDFSTISKGKKWQNGYLQTDGESIGIITHIPYAKVEGTVALNEDKREVRGTGYMDHTFQNETATRLIKGSYRFVSQKDSDNWLVAYALHPQEAQETDLIGYFLQNVEGVLSTVLFESFADGLTPSETPLNNVRLQLDDGSILTLKRLHDSEKISLLSSLPRIARRLARTFFGGEIIEYRGKASLTKNSGERYIGTYNISVVD